MKPDEVTARIPTSREIILTLPDYIPERILEALLEAKRRRRFVALLSGDFEDLDYLVQLTDLGLSLYYAVIPLRMYLFLERKVGYELPDFKPVNQPYEAACRLMLKRLGRFIVLRGEVGTQYEAIHFLQLRGIENFWVPYREEDRIREGDAVEAFGYVSYLDSRPPFLLETLRIRRT
jgi:hypothetical protein